MDDGTRGSRFLILLQREPSAPASLFLYASARAKSAFTLVSSEGLELRTERVEGVVDCEWLLSSAVELFVFRKIGLSSAVEPVEDCTGADGTSSAGTVARAGISAPPLEAAAISAFAAAKLDVALPTRRRSSRLSRRLMGPGESSSSESLQPNPVVKPTPSRRSLPSR